MHFKTLHSLFLFCLPLLLFLTSCGQPEPRNTLTDTISGRDNGSPPYYRETIWRIRRPSHWTLKETSTHSLLDSRLPVIEYQINNNISVFVHSFPSLSEEARIPPLAQVHRWKEQFDKSPPPDFHLERQAFSGYAGVLLDARGIQKKEPVRVLAWAFSLSPKNYFAVGGERGSDITIKVVGDEEAVDAHEEEIRLFARSFELIEAIP